MRVSRYCDAGTITSNSVESGTAPGGIVIDVPRAPIVPPFGPMTALALAASVVGQTSSCGAGRLSTVTTDDVSAATRSSRGPRAADSLGCVTASAHARPAYTSVAAVIVRRSRDGVSRMRRTSCLVLLKVTAQYLRR